MTPDREDMENKGGLGQEDPAADESPLEEAPSQDIPTGRFRRFLRLSALSAGTSSRYFGQKVKGMFLDKEARARSLLEAHKTTALKTVQVMGELKGAVMKVGQMVSLHPDNGILPTELTRAFSKLQSRAPTLPYASIKDQVEAELGAVPETLFAYFDEKPMAAASLGQVHAARLHSGEDVVVKVQYPGIDKTVESDLWQLRKLFDTTGFIGRRSEADLIFEELRERLKEELDYVQELANLKEFREFFRHEPALIIPRPFPEVSSSRVLTMEHLRGFDLEQALARHPEQQWRDELGETMFRLLLVQLMDFRRLHADPQLGNFQFLDDGRVIMLDLGCVKTFDATFLESYLSLVEAGVAREVDGIAHYLAELGILEPGRDEALEVVVDFCDTILEPFRRCPYRFSNDGTLLRRLKTMAPRFLAHPEIRGHPDMVYLHRTYIGLYFLLTKLEAQQDWWAMFVEQCRQSRDEALKASRAAPG